MDSQRKQKTKIRKLGVRVIKIYQLSQRRSAGTIRTLLCDVIKYPSSTWRLSMQHVRAFPLSYQVMSLRDRQSLCQLRSDVFEIWNPFYGSTIAMQFIYASYNLALNFCDGSMFPSNRPTPGSTSSSYILWNSFLRCLYGLVPRHWNNIASSRA